MENQQAPIESVQETIVQDTSVPQETETTIDTLSLNPQSDETVVESTTTTTTAVGPNLDTLDIEQQQQQQQQNEIKETSEEKVQYAHSIPADLRAEILSASMSKRMTEQEIIEPPVYAQETLTLDSNVATTPVESGIDTAAAASSSKTLKKRKRKQANKKLKKKKLDSVIPTEATENKPVESIVTESVESTEPVESIVTKPVESTESVPQSDESIKETLDNELDTLDLATVSEKQQQQQQQDAMDVVIESNIDTVSPEQESEENVIGDDEPQSDHIVSSVPIVSDDESPLETMDESPIEEADMSESPIEKKDVDESSIKEADQQHPSGYSLRKRSHRISYAAIEGKRVSTAKINNSKTDTKANALKTLKNDRLKRAPSTRVKAVRKCVSQNPTNYDDNRIRIQLDQTSPYSAASSSSSGNKRIASGPKTRTKRASGVLFQSGVRKYVQFTNNALVIKENYKRRLNGRRNSFFEPLKNKWLTIYDAQLTDHVMISNNDLTTQQLTTLGPITVLVEVLRERGIPFRGIAVANKQGNRYMAKLPQGEGRVYVGGAIQTALMNRKGSKWGLESDDYIDKAFNKITLEYLPTVEKFVTRKSRKNSGENKSSKKDSVSKSSQEKHVKFSDQQDDTPKQYICGSC